MKITDLTQKPSKKLITLNDIPVGQVFRGTITGATHGIRKTGIFYKHCGPARTSGVNLDCFVINLTEPGYQGDNPKNYYIQCVPVENYEPLKANLVIEIR